MSKEKGSQNSEVGSRLAGIGAVLKPIGAILKPIAAAAVASIVGVVAYVATPLNEIVNAWIWDESAEILVISQNQNPRQGDVITVDVFVHPKSPVPLSEGLLEITFTKGTLSPGAETAPLLVTTTGKIGTPTRLFGRTLEFVANAPGKAEIAAKLKTKRSEFSNSLSLDLAPALAQIFPTRRSFSGTWNIDLGAIHGQMELKDVARKLTGSYTLSDGDQGQIEGSRDGKTFRVTFLRTAPSRFFIEAEFDPDPNTDLEIHGKAKLLVPTGNRTNPWREERESEFNAVASAP